MKEIQFTLDQCHTVLNTKPGKRDFKFGEEPFGQRSVIFLTPPEHEYMNVFKADASVNQLELCNYMGVSNVRKSRNIFTYGHIFTHNEHDIGQEILKSGDNDPKLEIGESFTLTDVTEFSVKRKISNNGYDACSPNPQFGRVYLNFEGYGRKITMPTMYHDVRFYQSLKERSFKHRKHFLAQIAFGTINNEYHWTANELGGPNLLDLYVLCERDFTKPTIIQIGVQTLQAIHDVHLHHYMHRLIDPRSFVCGTGANHRVIYIVDFSLCYEYTNRCRRERFGYEPSESNVVTPLKRPKMHRRRDSFAPRNYHLASKRYQRIDDVESWFLMFHFFLQKEAHPMTYVHERVLYMQKCSIMFGACFPKEYPEIDQFLMAIVRGIDNYDEKANSIVDFPYFACILENIAALWKVSGNEPIDWMPSFKDRAVMILRSSVSTTERSTR